MKARLLQNAAPKTFALVFDKGDEVASGLAEFARAHRLSASRFTAIGAFSDVTVGYFLPDRKEYRRIPIREQVEVLSLVGDVTLDERGEPKVHAHAVVGKSDGSAHGGHLLEAHVWPTLEVVVEESPSHLRRRFDPEVGMAVIALDAVEPPESGAAAEPRGDQARRNVAAALERANLRWTFDLGREFEGYRLVFYHRDRVFEQTRLADAIVEDRPSPRLDAIIREAQQRLEGAAA
jgi:predicted DNA-binding protein with PD1-like motif